jgi:PBP1b-binding outer membrane lipoprotein LpoB
MKKLAAIIAILILMFSGCGKKSDPVSTQAAEVKKLTPEECYEKAYAEIRDASIADLKKSGNNGPYAEQELVPQGVRMSLEEDCKK